jgi:hypothetical protein
MLLGIYIPANRECPHFVPVASGFLFPEDVHLKRLAFFLARQFQPGRLDFEIDGALKQFD